MELTAAKTSGLAITGLGVAAAYALSSVWPVAGALTVAVVLGVAVGSTPVLTDEHRRAVAQLTKRLLRAGVVVLGLQLAVPTVLALGPGTLAAVVLTVAVTFLGTLGLGRLVRVPRGLALLVATGFSICGASAIAAMEGVVERDDEDVATAVALVTCYGSFTLAALPLLAHALGLDAARTGSWAGISVHEVAQVVAAAGPAGAAAVGIAVVVKLSRVVLLAPVVALVGAAERGRRDTHAPLVPLFLLGFLAMVAVRSTGLVPPFALDIAKTASTLLLAGALFGLGCAVRLGTLRRGGGRALLLGLLSTLLVLATGFGTLAAFT
ncbi:MULTISPECIES: putative sulfate exporter family transporter [unclassified Amycolatopsis]|uniref:YeiH family protein n=1 Tax=unclassified Amycolatopsis TaxID=2618356 RepID=UPI0028742B34|nr:MULTISPECIES: putative sulfate exporter family transporter [unclassified Amycolatopsis]MDS0138893.1 putative sulfate exporter family transporter [Amycolatopsis sp. 505]MDS0147565.1 putative sulfate exporter family transporter [Amycolatopsis sp. CM201R]